MSDRAEQIFGVGSVRPPDRAPILLLDVDGPLNPWMRLTKTGFIPPVGEGVFTFERHIMRPSSWIGTDDLPVLLSPGHGERLRALLDAGWELVWATTWEHDANLLVAPILGLPDLPVIVWPKAARSWALHERHRGSWKTPHIAAWIDEHRPGARWAWVDDDCNRNDRVWLAHAGHGNDFLVMKVWASIGLTDDHFARLQSWADHNPESA